MLLIAIRESVMLTNRRIVRDVVLVSFQEMYDAIIVKEPNMDRMLVKVTSVVLSGPEAYSA